MDICLAGKEQPPVQPDPAPCHPGEAQPAPRHPPQEVSQLRPNELPAPSPAHRLHPSPLHLRATPAKLKVSFLASTQAANNGEQLNLNEHNVNKQQAKLAEEWHQDRR